jgi:NAD(P)-dependent dehydrogenase (short-subunit alcohol dehydrogenase family)
MSAMQIAGTAALVTGAASGLGAATAAALADLGAVVTGVDLPTAVDKAEPPTGVTLTAADVTSDEQVAAVVHTLRAGPAPLRIVVNCAGIVRGARILGKSGAHDLEVFRTVLMVNLLGSFNVLRLAAQAIAATEPDAGGQRGVIVNTASVAAFEGQIGQIAYSASKGGVVAMTVPAARDLAQHGIRVNAIAPGIVDTPMMASITDEYRENLAAGVPFPKRLGTPAEYAQLVVMIVQHDYLNGETIRMDGALRMAPR